MRLQATSGLLDPVQGAPNQLRRGDPLAALLISSSGGHLLGVANAVCSICRSSLAVRQLVVGLAGLQPVITMLASSHLPIGYRQAAARAILDIDAKDEQIDQLVAELGGLQPLLHLLTASSVDCRQAAVLALWALASSSHAISRQVSQLGGLQPLIDLLNSDSVACQEHATLAIWTIWPSGPYVEVPNLLLSGTCLH